MLVLEDRSREVLEEWIDIFVETDPIEQATIIVTDGSAAYNGLE